MKQSTKVIVGIGFLVGGVFLISKLLKDEDSEIEVQKVEFQESETEAERKERLRKQELLYNEMKSLVEGRIDLSREEIEAIAKDVQEKWTYDPTKQIGQNLANVDWSGWTSNNPIQLDFSNMPT